jgi:secernin
MCDTILATPEAAGQQIMLFGKNSDRQRNEAQTVEFFPASAHGASSEVRCTYLSIPQASHTHAVLLCRPFWLWGAEMGANEHGVVIGNEGLHARSPAPEEPALTGMDLLRLGLERATSAAEAVTVITELLERYGQGGNCGHLTPSYYNNGFLIADSREAFVLETVGREWLLERADSVRTMSNVYSIDQQVERTSAGLANMLRSSGWSDQANPHYAQVIANPNREHIGFAKARRARSNALLTSREGRLNGADFMNVLRDHGPKPESMLDWHPRETPTVTVCMHATTDVRPGQTVGSMVSELHQHDPVHWVTATSAPCISIFKPVLMDAPPLTGPLPTDRFDAATLWWRHERMYRAALTRDFGRFLTEIEPERDAFEDESRARIEAVRAGGSSADRQRVVAQCWNEADKLTQRWEQRVAQMSLRTEGAADLESWATLNRAAGMNSVMNELSTGAAR